MKKLLMCLAVVLFAGMTFTSCGKKSEADLLLGKWSVTSVSTTIDGLNVEKKIEGSEYMYYTFTSDGKYAEEVNVAGEKWSATGKWVLENGKQLTLTIGEGHQVDEWFYTITELTSSKLTLKSEEGETMYLTKAK